jgi:hypothetical protein
MDLNARGWGRRESKALEIGKEGGGVKVARDLPLNAYCGRVRHHMNWKDMAGIGSPDYKVRTLVGGKNRSGDGGGGGWTDQRMSMT